LYDHQNDPEENDNLAVPPEHAALVEGLAAELERHWGRSNTTTKQGR